MLGLLIAVGWMMLGIFYCNGMEWVIHKRLHKLGKKEKSRWHFHWNHHGQVKKNNFVDPDYIEHGFDVREKEVLGIIILVILHTPVIWISPVLFTTILFGGASYLVIHQRSHKDMNWAKKYVPWHWDHHMGPREAVEANWCVTMPLFDYIMGTRVKYFGTKRYRANCGKRVRKAK